MNQNTGFFATRTELVERIKFYHERVKPKYEYIPDLLGISIDEYIEIIEQEEWLLPPTKIKTIPIFKDHKIGDTVWDKNLGEGIIHFINQNPKAKYPIKVHFAGTQVYSVYDWNGYQYETQKHQSLYPTNFFLGNLAESPPTWVNKIDIKLTVPVPPVPPIPNYDVQVLIEIDNLVQELNHNLYIECPGAEERGLEFSYSSDGSSKKIKIMGMVVWDEEFDDIEEIGDVRKSILEAYDNLLENLNFFAKAYSRIVNGK